MDDKESVYLRPLCVDDASVSFRWRNDPDIWRYTGNRPNVVVTEEMEREWAKKVIADKTRANFAICLSPSNRYIGNIYLVNINGCSAELGIFIGEQDCWGRGYGKDALGLLRQIAVGDLGLEEILIDVDLDNIPAVLTYLRNGAHFKQKARMELTIKLQQESDAALVKI